MNISLKSVSRSLTVVASLLCLGGVLSFIKSDVKMKPLALNIIVASGAIAVGNQFFSKWYEDAANNQLADIVAKHDKEWQTLNTKHQQQSQVLKETETLLINYFWTKGLRLDRAFTIGDVYESKIYFHTDNNPRTLVFKELNEHSEALQQLCLTLKPITFEWDADKGLMVASLTWKAREKEEKLDELSDKAIERLARSWDTWKKHALKWNRIRITGGSGAGKSPLTERIVSEQLQHKKVKAIDAIKLYNPQAGSRKDNWSFPSVGKTHQESIRGIAELTALCGRKYQGSFGIWIFDEVDSTLRQAPGKKRPTADDPEPEPTMSANMLSIITQIDHTSQAVFYLGQGANTGKIPNTTKGDWNNLVAIHINGNAKDYLRLADHIDTESKDKLMKQADLLQRYCDRKNSELGLDRVEPGAYRYALIDEYGRLFEGGFETPWITSAMYFVSVELHTLEISSADFSVIRYPLPSFSKCSLICLDKLI